MRRALPIVLLVLVCAPLFMYRLGRPGLGDPDEGRNAEAAREMLEARDWVTPRLNGAAYLDKPPAFFWMVAASFRLFGVHETAARLPSALFALAGIALLAWFGRRHLGGPAGLLAGALLALHPLYMVFGRLVIFDMMLAFWMTLAAVAAFEAMEGAPGGRRGRLWGALFFAAAGAGTITKGPVALVAPLAVAIVWAALRRRPSLLLRLRPLAGALLYAAIVGPWVVAVESRHPGFLQYALYGENMHRIVSNQFETARPFYFYLGVLLPGFFPWIVFLAVAAARRLRRAAGGTGGAPAGTRAAGRLTAWPRRLLAAIAAEDDRRRLALLYTAVWMATLLSFFSSIASKRPAYMLPLAAPAALLGGALWARAASERRTGAIARDARVAAARADVAAGAAGVATALVLLAAALIAGGPLGLAQGAGEGQYDRLLARGGLFGGTAAALAALAIVLAIGARPPGAGRSRRAAIARPATILAASIATVVVMVPLARAVMGHIDAARSSREVSRYLASRLAPDDSLVCFERYRPGLNFYLGRTLIQAKHLAGGVPFTSNYMKFNVERFRQDPRFRLIDFESFRDLLRRSTGRVFVIAPAGEYETLRQVAGGLIGPEPIWEGRGFALFQGGAKSVAGGASDPRRR